MGTILAVRTQSEISIGTDCLNTFEEILHPSTHQAEACLFKFEENFIGLNCSYALQQTIQNYLSTLNKDNRDFVFADKAAVRSFFNSVYDEVRVQQRIIPQHQANLPFEALPVNLMLTNRHGIFKVDAVRAVYEYKRFWAIGSAEAFALGALEATYSEDADAEALIRNALGVCSTFEGHRNRECVIKTIRSPNLQLASGRKGASHSSAKVLMHRGPVSIKRGKRTKKDNSEA